ncbi:hypothetical protein E4V42_23165 [Clostridium estertheticum]|uniref:Uncharacterized protein n=1 Tax=Clostridium estertheticum TaxID=238834 RepID=A0A5N7IVF8_9CLOT|nr:hypothetical protein [Clostridium estertheticum]MPQ34288.1 hypothetical protein [Clostridium estertheticum]MPQ64950.1 hypothetical protein [Clostridium estertheticum]
MKSNFCFISYRRYEKVAFRYEKVAFNELPGMKKLPLGMKKLPLVFQCVGTTSLTRCPKHIKQSTVKHL